MNLHRFDDETWLDPEHIVGLQAQEIDGEDATTVLLDGGAAVDVAKPLADVEWFLRQLLAGHWSVGTRANRIAA